MRICLRTNDEETCFLSSRQEYYDLDEHLYRVDSDGGQIETTKTGPGIDIRDMATKKSTFYNKKTGKKM